MTRSLQDHEKEAFAQRTSDELERAWARWRTGQGLDPLTDPSVAGYVAHGRDGSTARVVLGMSASDARHLISHLLGGSE